MAIAAPGTLYLFRRHGTAESSQSSKLLLSIFVSQQINAEQADKETTACEIISRLKKWFALILF
jgi:hypothetical protein